MERTLKFYDREGQEVGTAIVPDNPALATRIFETLSEPFAARGLAISLYSTRERVIKCSEVSNG